MTALGGVHVLDLSTGIAGPVVGMLFGDFGADVIRIDGPVPDPQIDSPGYAVWNRNKRSVLVDPGDHSDLEWLAASVRGADVVILGHGASLADWGHDVADAGRANTGLVILRLPAYLDGVAGWSGGESHLLLAGLGGQAARQSSNTGGPILSMSPYLLYIHGIWAATATVAALVERTVSGAGQVVTVTGVQGLIEATMGALNTSPAAPDAVTTVGPAGRHPTYRHFKCGDGLWMAVGALGPKFETGLLDALGLAERILEDPRIGGISAKMSLPENLPWTSRLVTDKFLERPRAELIELLTRIGIPCGPMGSREEWFHSEQIRAIGMHLEIDDPVRGLVQMPGIPIHLTASPGAVVRHAPRPGEHNGIEPWPAREDRLELDLDRPRYVPGPLHGFRVLNLGTFVASPYAGLLLAELGADVVKVEPYGGDPFRVSGYPYNRGMRSLAIDLAGEAGQNAVHKLVKKSDVVMDGMRPGVMKRLRLDYETLSRENPGIVTQSLSAYGEGGPFSAKPGVDMVIQAESGMMSSWGGSEDPIVNTIAINDVATAAMSALAVVLALYRRQVTGEGQRTWDSLAGTSVFLQMEHMVNFEGRTPPPIGHHDLRGLHPLRSYYETTDGWIGIDVPTYDDLAATGRLRAVGLVTDDDLGADLTASIGSRTVAEAGLLLAEAGVPHAEARRVSQVLRDPVWLEHQAFHIRPTDDGHTFMQTGRYAGFSRTQRSGPMSPPGIGEDTCKVLTEAGFDKDAISRLIDDTVVFAGGRIAHILPISYR